MDLYEGLAEAYDELFPQDHAATAFLLGLVRGRGLPRRVLDLGCATASQLLDLAAEGWEATGLEPSPRMRERALAKAELAEVAIDIAEGGMLDARSRFPASTFGLVLCLGNTLPHLPGAEEAHRFLEDASALLVRGGELVIQLLNYDLVAQALAGSGHAFPDLKAGHTLFRRRYESGLEGRLAFVTELSKEGQEAGASRTLLFPFRPAFLAKAVAEHGFGLPVLTAGWRAKPGEFDAGRDPYLILSARKR